MKLLRNIKIADFGMAFHIYMVLRDCGFYPIYDFQTELMKVYVTNA